MAKSPEEIAKEKAREKARDAAKEIDRAWNKAAGEVLPAAFKFLGMSEAESKVLTDAFNAFEAMAVAAVTGNWLDAAGKVWKVVSDLFSDPAKPKEPDAAQRSLAIVTVIYSLLKEQDRQRHQEPVDELLARARKASKDNADTFRVGDQSVGWLSRLDHAGLKDRADDALSAIDELLGVVSMDAGKVGNLDGDPHLPAWWGRWYSPDEIADRPWAMKTEAGAWWAQFYEPGKPAGGPGSGPLDTADEVFDHRVALAALSAMLPWTMAALALREPFWQTTGRFRGRFTDWADALEQHIIPRIDREILVAGWPNPNVWMRMPEEGDYAWVGAAAGAVNLATTEAVVTAAWTPGMYVEEEPDGTYTVYGAAGGTGWPDPALQPPDRLAENDAYVAVALPDFNDACAAILRERLPRGTLVRLVRTLRAAAGDPERSETFGHGSIVPAVLPGPNVSAGEGTISYDGETHPAWQRLIPTRVRLARPYVEPPGPDPVGIPKLDPGPMYGAGVVVQWPQMLSMVNSVLPIRYDIGLRGRNLPDDGIVWLASILGGDPALRTSSGVETIACSTFDFIAGGERPPLFDAALAMPDLAGMPAFPAADPGLLTQVTTPPFDGVFGHHAAKGMVGPTRDAEVRIAWTVEVQGGELTVTFDDLDDLNVTDVEVVIDEALAAGWNDGTSTPVRTTVPLVLVPRRVVAPKAYWDAVEAAGAAFLGVITRVWTEVPHIGPWHPGDGGPIPVEWADPARVVKALPGGLTNHLLQAALDEIPAARALFMP